MEDEGGRGEKKLQNGHVLLDNMGSVGMNAGRKIGVELLRREIDRSKMEIVGIGARRLNVSGMVHAGINLGNDRGRS